VLHFPITIAGQPIVYRLVKDFDLIFNILKASITPGEEGFLVLELIGKRKDYDDGIEYLTDLGVKIQPLSQDIVRDEDKCIHCGLCVAICPSGALYMEPETMRVLFDDSKCVACEMCVKSCPTRAIKVYF